MQHTPGFVRYCARNQPAAIYGYSRAQALEDARKAADTLFNAHALTTLQRQEFWKVIPEQLEGQDVYQVLVMLVQRMRTSEFEQALAGLREDIAARWGSVEA